MAVCEPVGRILLTVRPGPVLHVWKDGAEVGAVALSASAAICIAAQLLAAVTLPSNEAC